MAKQVKSKVIAKSKKQPLQAQWTESVLNVFQKFGLETGSISKTENGIDISGKDYSGKSCTMNLQMGNLSRLEVTCYKGTTIEDRRKEAKKLYKKGHTQKDIAMKLGVSQKTISNDINHG